ncbi:MAG: DEAD/DEAH box helicase [Desulfurivibrionaceae bacterium]|nr:DEAD/DEAH box helicase [Desulfurivibrionaceae bacterium]
MNEFTLTVGAQASLHGASPTLAEALRQQLTIDNPEYLEAKKYSRWMGKKLKPHLYFYIERNGTLTFPRGYANHAILLARKFMRQDPKIIDQRQSCDLVEFNFLGELRPYQEEAVNAITRHDFGVLEAGTGSGKTIIALAVIAKRRQPTLVLVHTKELLYQWVERARTFLGVEAGMIGDGNFSLAPVTIAIVNSARNRLSELPAHFGQLCVDECHRVPASLFTEVVAAFDCRYLLGLSATAFRRDGLTKLIYMSLGDRAFKVESHDLHESGAILKPEYLQRATEFRYVYRGNYQALMKSLCSNAARNQLIVEDILKERAASPGTILVVSDRVKHCEALAVMLEKQGCPSAVLTGKLPAEQRTALVDSIRQGEVKVLISTVQLIGEGFDCPDLATLFLTTPIKFTGRLLQVVGRVLRPAHDKQARVYDYVDPVRVLSSSAQSRWLTFQQG